MKGRFGLDLAYLPGKTILERFEPDICANQKGYS
jgi:hypothetical protein